MKRKKTLVFTTLALLLALSNSIQDNKVVVDASSSDVLDASKYYKADSKTVFKSVEFENDVSGVALVFGNNVLNHEVENPIDGSGSLSTTALETGYSFKSFQLDNNSAYRTPGRYFVEFDVKPVKNTTAVVSGVSINEGANSPESFICDYGIEFTFDDAGLANGANFTTRYGWKAGGYENGKVTPLGNGVLRCYYEYVVTEETQFTGTYNTTPLIQFKSVASSTDNEVLWDNVTFGQVGTPKYYTYSVNSTFEEAPLNGDPFHYSTFWGNDYTLETTNPISGEKSGKFSYNSGVADNTVLGAFSDNEAPELTNKNVAVSFDVKFDGLTKLNFWTSSVYTAVFVTPTGAVSEGAITNLSSSVNENGVVHVEYVMNYAGGLTLNGWGQGSVLIDNIVMSYEDYTPYVLKDSVNGKNEVYKYDLKGQTFTSLKCNDVVMNSADYILDETNHTISVLAANYNESKTYTLVSSYGEVSFEVGKVALTSVAQELVNEVTPYMNLAYQYTEFVNGEETTYTDVNFKLRAGLDDEISAMAQVYTEATWGIEVSTSKSEKVTFDVSQMHSDTENGIYYVILDLGDVMNDPSKALTAITVKAYVKVGETTYYSTTTKEYSVAELVKVYYDDVKTQDKVAHLYNYYLSKGLYTK